MSRADTEVAETPQDVRHQVFGTAHGAQVHHTNGNQVPLAWRR
jgi:hypothetical protein